MVRSITHVHQQAVVCHGLLVRYRKGATQGVQHLFSHIMSALYEFGRMTQSDKACLRNIILQAKQLVSIHESSTEHFLNFVWSVSNNFKESAGGIRTFIINFSNSCFDNHWIYLRFPWSKQC